LLPGRPERAQEAKPMPKRKTIDLPGDHHFVTFSTYQRRRFLAPDRTRTIVIATLESCLKEHHAACHGFVIMPDHVHAILTVNPDSNISTFLLAWKKTASYRVKKFYAQELKHYHDLCPEDCPVWQSRFYDFNLGSTDKFDEKLEYMHNNPVVAGLIETAVNWKWSSARFYENREEVGVTITPLL
jgi:putative transposase